MNYESKWLRIWDKKHVFESDPIKGKKKIFVTFPYPYMNGPVHVGTAFTSVRVDIYARFKRMQGYNVLFPWAWHWTGQSIVGLSYRLKLGDKNVRRALVEIDGVPESEVEKFVNPEYLASYYTNVSRDVIKKTGYSIDWRREFTTIDPAYQRFVEWQYLTLRERGYVVQGTHPVVWCPNDKSPTGDHDRMEGVGVYPEEFSLVKFQLGEFYLVSATLRPETIYGATNVWVNPNEEYAEAKVDNEPWIVSLKALTKISEQRHEIKLLRSFKGSEILGRFAIAPLTGKALPVLPALFVDTELATGVVYSVPAHAPFDYMGLEDIKQGKIEVPEEVKKIAESIQPVPIISISGYSDIPAKDIVERYGIKDSLDQKFHEATSKLYKDEFHLGIMKKNTGPLSGLKVAEAKQKAVELLRKTERYSTILDLPEKVVCRCGTRCYVKILENQWFLNYSNKEWKERTKYLIEKANVLPPESREWYYSTIEWLEDKPCVRRSGMGTRLPWDKDWIVETLSDSTIYMAFYTISKYINTEQIHQDKLKPEVLDFIFLGKGRPERISKEFGVNVKLLKKMRDEFLYWYPVDLRNSAKELIPNHLTFFAFHHAAMFEEKHWPRCFSVNGMIQIEGKNMSKTQGRFVTWRSALERYGADAFRLALSLLADGMDDANWTSQRGEDAKARVDSLITFFKYLTRQAVKRETKEIDNWITSTFGKRIAITTEALENMKIRKAASTVFMDIWNDIRWYVHRAGRPRKDTIKPILESWVKLISPFTPFLAEELNKLLGGKELVCVSQWPDPSDFKQDEKAELSEEIVSRVLDDARSVLKLLKERKTKLRIVVAERELLETFLEILEGKKRKDELSRKLVLLGVKPERLFKLRYEIGEEMNKKLLKNSDINEFEILNDAKDFIGRELNLKVEVEVYKREKQEPRAKEALPLKPALYFE
jgi:leucyl-tRNA synthetase